VFKGDRIPEATAFAADLNLKSLQTWEKFITCCHCFGDYS